MSVKAYLLDMDGTLANSEKFFVDESYKLVVEHGINLSYLEVTDIVAGCPATTMIEFIKEICKCTLEEADKIHTERFYDSQIDYATYLYSETKEVLNALKEEGYLLALVTSNNKRNIDNFLNCLDANIFDCIVSSEIDNIDAKPSPAPYLLAMKKLGVKAHECIVVEDSPMGIESGIASEAYVIATKQSGLNIDTSRANRTIDNLIELIR